MRNLSYENEFCVQFHFHAKQSHFHNGFALGLALKQRRKGILYCNVLDMYNKISGLSRIVLVFVLVTTESQQICIKIRVFTFRTKEIIVITCLSRNIKSSVILVISNRLHAVGHI